MNKKTLAIVAPGAAMLLIYGIFAGLTSEIENISFGPAGHPAVTTISLAVGLLVWLWVQLEY